MAVVQATACTGPGQLMHSIKNTYGVEKWKTEQEGWERVNNTEDLSDDSHGSLVVSMISLKAQSITS